MHDTTIWWARKDLRLHDNETLAEAADAEACLPVYIFDPRDYGEGAFGGHESFSYERTGPHRARFLRESVRDLRESLRERDSDLIVRTGHPEEILPELADRIDADAVYLPTYPTSEEVEVEEAVKTACRERDVTPQRFWTHTLYHINDLPEPASDIDDTFTPFRKTVERNASVRDPIDEPALPAVPDIDPGEVPTVGDLGVESVDPDDRAVLPFEGGEIRGLERVEEYVWTRDRLRQYKETRNGMLGADYSSNFSPWLNQGCLSPREVHDAVKRYEDERVSNDSTYWLVFELLWRDFFQFQFVRHGTEFFTPGGIRDRDIRWRDPSEEFERWAAGETGIPFVDANMRELNATGYMSNRGRQNVASFLAKNLRIDWRRGAAHFETQLVDYDPCSNYGNWAYNAGVGNDSRDSYFNIVKQARRYDGDADYVKRWCPELEPLPPEYAHEPWTMSTDEQVNYGVELGVDYPQPMIDLEASYEKLRR